MLCAGLTGCGEVTQVTSHYGHGQYSCYYHNEATNQSFKEASGKRETAVEKAREACEEASGVLKNKCYLAECVFR